MGFYRIYVICNNRRKKFLTTKKIHSTKIILTISKENFCSDKCKQEFLTKIQEKREKEEEKS